MSDLPDTFFDVPALWVHGHTHSPFDYRRAGCRVLSNPRGYRLSDGSLENQQFNAGLVVEVLTQPQRRRTKFVLVDGQA